MEEIKILFFIVGTFFGVDQSRIIAESTTVTIDPEEKTITILQEDLISLIRDESDSLKVQNELTKITQTTHPWSSELTGFTKKHKNFYSAEDEKTLNLELRFTYTSPNDLSVFGIHVNNDGNFSMTNFPKSHLSSTDGTLGERYWVFDANQSFSFTEAPLTDLPDEYLEIKKSLLLYWLATK